jgi:hypothetical protein
MSVLVTRAFWAATLERAVKTAAQAALALIGVAGVTPADLDWKEIALGAGFGALASLLTSIASSGVGNAGPSLSSEVLTPPAPAIPADDAN